MPRKARRAAAYNLLVSGLRPEATHYQDGVGERGDQCFGSESNLTGRIRDLGRDPDRTQQGSNQFEYAKHQ